MRQVASVCGTGLYLAIRWKGFYNISEFFEDSTRAAARLSSDWTTIVTRGGAALLGIALCLSPMRAGADQAVLPVMPIAATPAIQSHPFVFTTKARLERLVGDHRNIPAAGRQFLQNKVTAELAVKDKYITPYGGCQLSHYLKQFTYEQGSATRAAADFALYAYLHDLDKAYGTDALASEASQTAKTILLNWANGGLHDDPQMRTRPDQFCDDADHSTDAVQFDVGLTIGRGMPHWIAAQDLLLGLQALSPAEAATLDAFIRKLADLETAAMRLRAAKSHLDCNRFSNHVSVQIAALASAARLLRDRSFLSDVADGSGRAVAIPWTEQVSKTIYGAGDAPLACYSESANPSLFHQTATVQPGEIDDRYRAKGAQPFGYPMFSLTNLMLAADIFDGAGADASHWQYKGKSLYSALHYYAYYFSHFMEPGDATVPITSADGYPGFAQYAGKLLSRQNGTTIKGSDGLIIPYILGARMFPNDPAIKAVLQRATQAASGYSVGQEVDSLFVDNLPMVADIAGD